MSACGPSTSAADSGVGADAGVDSGQQASDGAVARDDGPITEDSGIGPLVDAATTGDAGTATDSGAPGHDGGPADGGALTIKIAGNLDVGGMSANRFRALLEARGRVSTERAPTFDASFFADANLVVGDLAAPLTVAQRAALAAYVTARRGRVLVLGGYVAGEEAETHSVVQSFSMAVNTTAPVLFEPVEFMSGATSSGGLSAPPRIFGAFQFQFVNGPLAAAEVRTSSAMQPWVAARYDSGTGGRVFVWLDDHATFDPQLDANGARFWNNVLDYLQR